MSKTHKSMLILTCVIVAATMASITQVLQSLGAESFMKILTLATSIATVIASICKYCHIKMLQYLRHLPIPYIYIYAMPLSLSHMGDSGESGTF